MESVLTTHNTSLPARNDPSTPTIPAKRSVKAVQYEADLQRAIALSLAEGNSISATRELIGSHPGMSGRQLEGSDAVDPEDEDLRLAIEASLADVPASLPTAPGLDNSYDEEEEISYKVSAQSRVIVPSGTRH